MWTLLLLLGCPPDDPKPEGADGDADGHVALADGGDDCDDADPAVHPDAAEVCGDGGVDEDCDGLVDDDDPDVTGTLPWSPDVDNDGYGDPAGTVAACAPPTGGGRWVGDATDCDDGAFGVNPGATEVCDDADVDEDCDGSADDADDAPDPATLSTFHGDGDGDGYGAGDPILACDPAAGAATNADDCDDADPAVNPGATERCDPADVDENCNGAADSSDPTTDPTTLANYYVDGDGDGYGAEPTGAKCEAAAGESALGGDCDDDDARVSPVATEVCDARDTDEDCDGTVDDGDTSTDPTTATAWYPDADEDGHGAPDGRPVSACDDPSDSTARYAPTADDCDDTDGNISPSDREICDDAGVDEDCDGLVDGADSCNVSPDTGVVTQFYAGDVQVDSAGNFAGGHWGTVYADTDELPDFDVLCSTGGEWTDTGRSPPACRGCDWVFNLQVTGATADGDWCSDLGVSGSEWDGFTASWGFAASYTYGRYVIEFAVLYSYGRSWYPISFNYGGYGYNTGDADSIEFATAYDYSYLY